jgi:2-iminobutanoate/2-iminopropanoate deaminase
VQAEALQPEGIAVPKALYSPVVVSGDLVLTAGQVAFDPEGNVVSDGIEAQARQAFDNLVRCLEAAGCGLGDVLKVTTFLADLADFEAYNGVYGEYFSPPYPARTTVEAGLAPGLRIEVEAIARRRA